MTLNSTLAAAAAALILATPMAHATGGSWICENQMDMDSDEARAISGSNNALYNILMKYRERWDTAYRMAQCEAYAEGRPYDISCLNDRRDWDAIKAMVPEEYFGMSNDALHPHSRAMESNREQNLAMISYCRDVGAIE
ncbi:hypothetical protein LX81_02978 [Palleronia aestuarii]|uniref:Uncharacterized protein n=1 Tax=Palleronia aestuarii TaxID=568105 RepID=A0A2W7PXC9_9RHOB|nr:hypothetical protein [Palleronia aestuarii]PZX14179.1 hypothetical protein LX81_02978 [Palleronia aestuarii]